MPKDSRKCHLREAKFPKAGNDGARDALGSIRSCQTELARDRAGERTEDRERKRDKLRAHQERERERDKGSQRSDRDPAVG